LPCSPPLSCSPSCCRAHHCCLVRRRVAVLAANVLLPPLPCSPPCSRARHRSLARRHVARHRGRRLTHAVSATTAPPHSYCHPRCPHRHTTNAITTSAQSMLSLASHSSCHPRRFQIHTAADVNIVTSIVIPVSSLTQFLPFQPSPPSHNLCYHHHFTVVAFIAKPQCSLTHTIPAIITPSRNFDRPHHPHRRTPNIGIHIAQPVSSSPPPSYGRHRLYHRHTAVAVAALAQPSPSTPPYSCCPPNHTVVVLIIIAIATVAQWLPSLPPPPSPSVAFVSCTLKPVPST